MKKKFKYLYGPVSSWRLGSSLGIDLLSSRKKACNFDCIYCQLGSQRPVESKRKEFVPTAKIIEELRNLPPVQIDVITFSGRGEPTLAKNLGQVIRAIKKIRKEKIAILTNASLIGRKDIQKDLLLADFVIAKLDASAPGLFKEINRPGRGITLGRLLRALKGFRKVYQGILGLQIMFVEKNIGYAQDIATLAQSIRPDVVQINTPLRPSDTQPLSRLQIKQVSSIFKGLPTISVYSGKAKRVRPFSKEDTLSRRGML